jgi:hypothetical protein
MASKGNRRNEGSFEVGIGEERVATAELFPSRLFLGGMIDEVVDLSKKPWENRI